MFETTWRRRGRKGGHRRWEWAVLKERSSKHPDSRFFPGGVTLTLRALWRADSLDSRYERRALE